MNRRSFLRRALFGFAGLTLAVKLRIDPTPLPIPKAIRPDPEPMHERVIGFALKSGMPGDLIPVQMFDGSKRYQQMLGHVVIGQKLTDANSTCIAWDQWRGPRQL